MKPVQCFSLLLLTIFLFSCAAEKKIGKLAKKDVLQKQEITSAHIGISIMDATSGKYLYNYQGDKYFVPASNTKIPTCYAAMKYLGDSLVGLKYADINDSTVLIKGVGDPTLLAREYKQHAVVDFLKQQQKQIILTASNDWKAALYGSGWTWNDYDAAYMPERNELPIYGNTIIISKTAKGFKTNPAALNNIVEGLTIDSSLNGRFYLQRSQWSNTFSIEKSAAKFVSQETPLSTGKIMLPSVLLMDATGKEISVTLNKDSKAYAWKTVKSQPTDSMLKPMMHRSDNLYAEQSLLMVSDKLLGVMDDDKIIDTLLKTDFANLPQPPRWVDGSGLSRYNLFTPQDFVYILQKMKTEFDWNRITTIFQTGGEGTINSYYKNLQGKIYAKTGTLSGQVALSGYLITKKNKTLIFSVLVNNHQTSATTVRRAVEAFITNLYEKY
jgi:D-alanyl-D-alanine carboxypeptidase/D-alanyl-D-alanine-endopeptidase (penicillin-binding protein 4)